jgi:effector-binding domain-containing protein
MDPNTFDFEISVPVRSPVAAVGRVTPGLWPATRVARTVYRGGYEGLGEAWGEFNEWIVAQGHRLGPDCWECYAKARSRPPTRPLGVRSSPDRWSADQVVAITP